MVFLVMVNNCVNYIKNIDFNILKPNRAGVIVYTVYKKKTYFILGIDTKSGDVTDFGGGVSFKKENALIGGLREFAEETLGIFGNISINEIGNCVSVYDDNNLIIFIPLQFNIAEKYYEFLERIQYIENPEVMDLKILNKKEFISLINGKHVDGTLMYDRIRDFLSNTKLNSDFMRLL